MSLGLAWWKAPLAVYTHNNIVHTQNTHNNHLQLCQHVAGLGLVEGTAGDEQDMVCGHVAVLGGHSGALSCVYCVWSVCCVECVRERGTGSLQCSREASLAPITMLKACEQRIKVPRTSVGLTADHKQSNARSTMANWGSTGKHTTIPQENNHRASPPGWAAGRAARPRC